MLIACRHSVEQIARIIGVDTLGYLSLENVVRLTGEKQGCGGFCKACFDGEYPTKIPSTESKNRFEKKISERESQ